MPTYTDLYISNAVQQGDASLSPEKNSAFKIGSRYRQTGFSAVLSGFYTHGKDMIDWVQTTETEPDRQQIPRDEHRKTRQYGLQC